MDGFRLFPVSWHLGPMLNQVSFEMSATGTKRGVKNLPLETLPFEQPGPSLLNISKTTFYTREQHTHTQIQTQLHKFKHTFTFLFQTHFLTQLSSFNAPLFHWNKCSTLFIFRESPGLICLLFKLNITLVHKSIKANNSKSKFESLAPIILS